MKKKVTKKEFYQEVNRRLPETSKLDPRVYIHFAGQKEDHILEFNNLAVRDVLKDCGFNLLTEALTPDKLGNPDVLVSLIHRGLQLHHPTLTPTDVDGLITIRHFPYIERQIREALSALMPDMDEYEKEEDKDTTQVP